MIPSHISRNRVGETFLLGVEKADLLALFMT